MNYEAVVLESSFKPDVSCWVCMAANVVLTEDFNQILPTMDVCTHFSMQNCKHVDISKTVVDLFTD